MWSPVEGDFFTIQNPFASVFHIFYASNIDSLVLASTKMCMFKWSGQHHVPAAWREEGHWLSNPHCVVLWVPLDQQWWALLAMFILHSTQAQLNWKPLLLLSIFPMPEKNSRSAPQRKGSLVTTAQSGEWPPQQGAGRHCLSKGAG